MIWAFALFVLALLVISALRRRLLFEIQGSSLLLFSSDKPGLFLYSAVMFPGTILHELSHWLMAEILLVKTGQITLIPEKDSSHLETRLGSVATARTDPVRGFLIGIAPFVSGLFVLFLLGYFLELGWGTYHWWIIALLIYGEIVVGNSMITSQADLRYWPFVAVLFTVFLTAYYYSGLSLSLATSAYLTAIITRINMVLGLTIILSLAMILMLYVLRRTLEWVVRKRITR